MHLFRFPGGIAGFSEKTDGNLNFLDQSPEQIAGVWRAIPAIPYHGLSLPRFASQVHGARVLVVPAGSPDGLLGAGDALATGVPGVPVGVFTSDCLPVLVAVEGTPETLPAGIPAGKGAVMAVHAGWKGTRQGITGRAIDFLRGAFPQAQGRITVFMGPCIGACCLELGDEVAEEFRVGQLGSLGCFSQGGKWHLDLRALNVIQCLERGIPLTSIRHVNHCTKCLPDRYYSYRYQGGRGGSLFSFIARFPDASGRPVAAMGT